MSSLSGLRGNRGLGVYSLTKAALAQLARNLAVEWGPVNVRANAIAPGVIDIAFAEPLKKSPDALRQRLARTPWGVLASRGRWRVSSCFSPPPPVRLSPARHLSSMAEH